MSQQEGQECCQDRHTGVEEDLGDSNVGLKAEDNRTDEGFAGQHDNVCKHLKIHAKAQDDTACQQIQKLGGVLLRLDKAEHGHTQINKIAKGDRDRELNFCIN